jgi:hypothetical protein
MLNRRQRGEAALLTAERRKREDDAPRLRLEVPRLSSLRLDIDEGKPGSALAGAGHIRRIVVERAPALFVHRCADTDCKEGGVHDFTHDVMRALRQGAAHFEGEASCDRCACVLRYRATAAYAELGGESRPAEATPGMRR